MGWLDKGYGESRKIDVGSMKVLAIILALAAPAAASDLLGPIWHLQGKHIGDGEPLTWNIEYYDEWGRTIVDAAGGHFYHDRCCGGFRTDDPSWIYPAEYWNNVYQLYYIGTTMRYRITLCNTGNRSYENIRVVAIQEYLTTDGSWGEWIGPDAAKDWYLESLRAGECVTLDGSLFIPEGAHGGLDQTHLQVQHWNRGSGKPGPGSVIIDDAQAAVWCPPDEHGVTPTDPTRTAARAGEVTITGGIRGYLRPGGDPATIEVNVVEAGEIDVRIYDQRGRLVRKIRNHASGGRVETMLWDGTDSSGSAVVPGVYQVFVQGPGIQAKEKIAVVR